MPLFVVVQPRFGDSARVAIDEMRRPQLVADIGTGSALSIQVNDEPGSPELAAQFARELASAALRFADRCDELMAEPAVTVPVACINGGAVGDL